MNDELLSLLSLLEENTSAILTKLEENKKIEYDYYGELLGDIKNVSFETENGLTYSIEEGKIILNGINRYANLNFIYYEKDYIPNQLGKYMLHLEGYKVKGCSNAYINSISNLINKDNFVLDIPLTSNWNRNMKIRIFVNHTTSQSSEMAITSLKLTKVE